MERNDIPATEARRLDEGYRDQDALLADISTWLDQLLYAYYQRHQWVGPSSDLKNMLGMVVSREEFEYNLAKAAEHGLENRLTREEREELDYASRVIRLRLERTRAAMPLLQLFRRFRLSTFEGKCVILAYIGTAERKYERLFAYLQDDITKKWPGYELAIELFLPRGSAPSDYLAEFFAPSPFLELFMDEPRKQGLLRLREPVVQFLTCGKVIDPPWQRIFDGGREKPALPLLVQEERGRLLDEAGNCPVLLSGAAGSGKRFQVEHCMARRRESCVFADLAGGDWRERAGDAALAARLGGASLCLYHLDRKDEAGELTPPGAEMLEVLTGLELFGKGRFLLSRRPVSIQGQALEIRLPELCERERLTLFQFELRDAAVPEAWAEELSAKFHFTPRQIHLACQQALRPARTGGQTRLSVERLHAACYAQAVHRLDELASRVPAAYTWDDVILPPAQKELLRRACGRVRCRHRVYSVWGFERKISYGRGLSILFAGAPGTGKTMCAQVIANELHMRLHKINLSQVVSKYIGETEKNLQAVFHEAKNADSILFFDECDALFGKRSEVKDAHDRNANVEVAYLLQQIEEYDGVCILATNLIGNIDEAFMRRITYVVRFPFPDAPMREKIFRGMLPAGAPVSEDIDWAFLAEKFQLSGGYIKNIVLAAAFLAAGEDGPISMRHLIHAAVDELKKNDIVVIREQLQEYADLLEDGGEADARAAK